MTGSKIDESVRDSLLGSSYTVTETMKTPAGGTYTQRDGDTFIGRSTNLLFGKGESVDLFRQDDGTFKLGQKESICTGEQFSTTFVYPHQYIEDVLIPNWQLSDAEPTTALSVDVYKSQRGWEPIFRIRGGQSSQPYEGATYTKYANPGTKLDEATMRVEKPELRINGATTVTDVPTGGQAKFNLQLYNASETNSVCTYSLKAVEGSNPNGAQLFIDGAPLSDGAGRKVRMKGGETIDKQLIVMQSDRYIRDYENIKLVLCSTNDTATVSDPVVLNVHFVPTSALVDIAVNQTVLNQELLQKNGGVIATMRNLDYEDEGLVGLRVRFRKKGIGSWTLAKEWSVDKVKEEMAKSPNKQITTAVAFPEDGLYELQAQTFGKYGNSEVTYETEMIEVLQDTHGAKLLGMVSPEDGLLTWLNRNNMHLRFNEELNDIALSKSNNFRIEGGMNNMVADKGRPYPDVALQLNKDSVATEAIYDLSDTGFAFDLWLYRQGDGKIISLGTNNNLLSLSTHDGGLVSVLMGDEDNIMDAIKRLPENTWTYVAMNYKPKDDDKSMGELTLLYSTANDDKVQYVFRNEEIEALDCHGKLSVGGGGMQGMVTRVSAWGSDVTAETLYEDRNKLRVPYTPGLIGY